jgi:hypothetical protein
MFNKKILTVAILTSLLGGCKVTVDELISSKDSTPTNKTIVEKKSAFKVYQDSVNEVQPKLGKVGEEKSGYYVNTNNYIIKEKKDKLPISFTEDVKYLNKEFTSASNFSTDIYKSSNVVVSFIDKTTLIAPLDFKKGSLEDLFNYIAVANDLKWKYNQKLNKVFFYMFTSQTFSINEQNINNFSDWDSIENSIETLLSEKGKVSFNRDNGTVLITDNDLALIKVQEHLNKINKTINQKVTMDFSIITIKLKEQSNVDLKLIEKALHQNDYNYTVASPDGVDANLLEKSKSGSVKSLISTLKTLGNVSISNKVFSSLNNKESSFHLSDNNFIIVKPKIVNENIMFSYLMNDKNNSNEINQTMISKNGQTNILMLLSDDKTITKGMKAFDKNSKNIVIITATPYFTQQ